MIKLEHVVCPATPAELRELVFDYLLHTRSVQAAQAFAEEALSEPDAPADAPDRLHDAQLRKAIIDKLMQGNIATAISLCNERDEYVLEPVYGTYQDSTTSSVASLRNSTKSILHESPFDRTLEPPIPAQRILALDLSIQEFIESVREGAAKSAAIKEGSMMAIDPPRASTLNGHLLTTHNGTNGDATSQISSSSTTSSSAFVFSAALAQAQALFKQASKIADNNRRMYYQKLLQDVGALFLYQDLEKSPVAHFLDLSRRAELAERLNLAMLETDSNEGVPKLQTISKHVAVVWNELYARQSQEKDKEGAHAAKKESSVKNVQPTLSGPFTLGSFLDGGLTIEGNVQ